MKGSATYPTSFSRYGEGKERIERETNRENQGSQSPPPEQPPVTFHLLLPSRDTYSSSFLLLFLPSRKEEHSPNLDREKKRRANLKDLILWTKGPSRLHEAILKSDVARISKFVLLFFPSFSFPPASLPLLSTFLRASYLVSCRLDSPPPFSDSPGCNDLRCNPFPGRISPFHSEPRDPYLSYFSSLDRTSSSPLSMLLDYLPLAASVDCSEDGNAHNISQSLTLYTLLAHETLMGEDFMEQGSVLATCCPPPPPTLWRVACGRHKTHLRTLVA